MLAVGEFFVGVIFICWLNRLPLMLSEISLEMTHEMLFCAGVSPSMHPEAGCSHSLCDSDHDAVGELVYAEIWGSCAESALLTSPVLIQQC